MNQRGAVLVEMALVLPLLMMVLLGAFLLSLAILDDARLERATADAAEAYISEEEAHSIVAAVNGQVDCWWRGEGEGECYSDGLTLERTQVATSGHTWEHPFGDVTPRARASVPVTPPVTVTIP